MSAAGWTTSPLADVAELYQGYGFPKTLQGRSTGDLGFYKVSDISRAVMAGNEYLGPAVHCISNEDARSLRATPLPKNSVVFARIGEAINLNRRALLPANALVDNNVIGAKARPGVDDRYLLHFLNTVRLGLLSQATTVPAVRTSDIAAIETPVAPADEQRRIVSKIDELFSRIDEGEAALARVEKLVERYRQSVLKAAVTGELTREWRASRKRAGEPVESGAALLARILKARRTAWETAELAKLKAKGKPPADDRWKQKYQEPAPPDTTDLPELPEGWVWISMDAVTKDFITGPFGSALHRSDYVIDGTPLVNPINLRDGTIVADRSVSVSPTTLQRLMRYRLEVDDIVLARRGEMGRCAYVTDKEAGWLCGTGSAILRCTDVGLPAYIALAISSGHSRAFLEDNCVGTTMHNLNQNAMSKLPVPLPCVEEQRMILLNVRDRFAEGDALFGSLSRERNRSAALRQSILKAAFSGQLVPQDPHDEPASKLLERIAAERAAAPALHNRRKKSP